ncbi:glycosyltransferase [Sphingomonas montana]|uniref:glycosyltransferase n=1 Tax=Sphingomonas montana TaxID=1843236 RepID=UPI00096DC470|nr:glycosyltransferase [Sphingomonas montana]
MRRKVMFVINSLTGGGAERVMATLMHGSAALAERHDIVLVLLDRDEDAYALPGWLRTIRLDCRHSLARSLTQLWRTVAVERPDVAVGFLTRANVVTAAVMAARRRPFLLSERVNTSAHLGAGRAAAASRLLVRATYRHATEILAVSEGVADTLVSDFGVSRTRVTAIPNPIDTDIIEARAAEPSAVPVTGPYIAAMGRLVPNKNFALAIEAFAVSGIAGRLVIMGQGPEEAALRALGQRLGLGDRLVLPGFVANPHAVIARADAVVLSSNAEGFPNALVESLAAGTPVVATDCPSGPAEVLDVRIGADGGPVAGRGGYLVPMNAVTPMAEALRAVVEPARRAALIEAGRARVRDYSVARGVERYWARIEAALR